jgi:hypothetical protein
VIATKLLFRRRCESAPAAAVADWSAKRSLPIDSDRVLVSHTHLWLRRIPAPYQPKYLCRQYPRIANALAECWNDPVSGNRLLMDLIVDRRGGRAGFPSRIVGELHMLRQLRERTEARNRTAERIWRSLRSVLGDLSMPIT